MDNKHLLSLLQTNFRTVHVIFEDSSVYPGDNEPAQWGAQPAAQPRRNDVPRAPQRATTQHAPQRAYVYKCHNSMAVEQGQQAVVMTDGGMRIVTVVKVDDFADIDLNADYDYKWVVSVIDTAVYDDLLDKEAKFNRLVTEARRTKVREETLASFKSVLPTEGEAAKLFHEAFNLFDVNNAKPVVS